MISNLNNQQHGNGVSEYDLPAGWLVVILIFMYRFQKSFEILMKIDYSSDHSVVDSRSSSSDVERHCR